MELYRSKKETPEEKVSFSTEELYDQLVNQKKSIKEIYNLNDKHIEEIYSIAENYYQNSRYIEAKQIFSSLATIDSKNYKVALGYASTLHQLGEFPLAILAFWRAYELNIQDPQPIFFVAEGLYQIEEWEAAEEQYELFIHLTKENKNWDSLRAKAKLVLKGLRNREAS